MREGNVDVRNLGWGFLLAWVFCVFYTGPVDGLSAVVGAKSSDIAQRLVVSVLPVASAVVTLVAVVAAERRLGSPAESRALVVAAPVLVAAATPVLLLPVELPGISQVLFTAAAALTGAGSGLMWVMWGQLYARLPQDAVERCAPVSAVLAAVLSLVAMVLPDAACIAVVSVYPLVSGVLFAKAWPIAAACLPADHAPAPAAPLPLGQAVGSMGRAGFGIFAACFFVSVEGSFWEAPAADIAHLAGVFAASALFMLAVTVSATAGPRRVSLSFAYRWMCPFMVAGFAALIVLGPGDGAFAAAAIGIASRFAFCTMTQMYFAAYAARGVATAVQSYAVGWLFVHLGDLVGVLVSVPLQRLLANGAVGLDAVSATLMVLLVCAVMLALNEGRGFLAWGAFTGVFAGEGVVAAVPSAAAPVCGASRAVDAGPRVAVGEGGENGSPAASGAASEEVASSGPVSGESVSREPEPADVALGEASASAVALGVSPEGPGQPAETPVADVIAERVAVLAAAHKLTPRETEVFGLLAHGRSIPYVRDALFISRDTAATHAKHIYAKLDVHSRQELIDLVMSNEL